MKLIPIGCRSFFGAVLVLLSNSLSAQVLRGEIRDKDSGRPVGGAVITFHADRAGDHQVTCDSSGVFMMEGLPAGTGALFVEKEGYAPFSLAEVVVAAGKDKIVQVLLMKGVAEASLPVVNILETRPLRQTSPLGEIPLSRDQTLYYPMTYFDPARLAMSWPGVAQTDDGTNMMSIRGNNPAFVRWRLQGIDIVNPNHLPNAGTFSDRPALGSGGVLMLSAQMIDNSSLITGAGTVGYNDGIGGIMDLNLRKGNNQRHEQTIQAGLTGLDVAVEGPFSARHRSSYLINYRYSTVGILGKLGVSFGGEKINFQDLAMHFNFPIGKRGNLSLYALGGTSSNIFTPPDSATVYKELFHIDYHSATGIAGISFTGYAGNNFSIKSGFSVSGQVNDRSEKSPFAAAYYDIIHNRVAANCSMEYKATSNTRLLFGGNYSFSSYDSYGATITSQDLFETDNLLQGWLASETTLLDGAIKFQVGVNPITTEYGSALDPRMQIFWRPAQKHQLVFSLASYSQGIPLWAGVSYSTGKLLQAVQYAARYQWTPVPKWVFSAEAYTQSIENLPVSGIEENGYSVINENESIARNVLVSEGTGRNTGIEVMAFHHFSEGWFANANITLLQSNYQGSDGITRRTRWDVGHIANLTAGKEWHRRIKKNLSARIFGIDSRAVWMGGTRTAPIDITQSALGQTTVFDYSNGYTGQNGDYFRIDGRFYWKRGIRNRRNSTFALEFQNLTGQKNIAYRYYDPLTKKVETRYQLGLIPNLSWRLEF